jgi:hypothetical protein
MDLFQSFNFFVQKDTFPILNENQRKIQLTVIVLTANFTEMHLKII